MAEQYNGLVKKVVDKLKQIDLSEWKQNAQVDGPGAPEYFIFRKNNTIYGLGFRCQLDDDFARSKNDDKYVLIAFEEGCTTDRRLQTFRGSEVRSLYEHLQQQRQDYQGKNASAVLKELMGEWERK